MNELQREPFLISPEEKSVLIAYRKSPPILKSNVRKILDLTEQKKKEKADILQFITPKKG